MGKVTEKEFKEIKKKYHVFKKYFIYLYKEDIKILYPTEINFNFIFKKKDMFIYLNYETFTRFLFFDFLRSYNGKDKEIKYIKKLLKDNSKLHGELKILDDIIKDKYLFDHVVKKYFPDKDIKYDLSLRNFDLFNHMFVHKEKIFSEKNVSNLISRYIKKLKIPKENPIVNIINSGLIDNMKAEKVTIKEEKWGFDVWLINNKNNSKIPVKTIVCDEGSDINMGDIGGVIKLILQDVSSDITNFERRVKLMRYKFIIIYFKNKLIFINTKPIENIKNRKLDKLITIEFNSNIKTKKDVKNYMKSYNVK